MTAAAQLLRLTLDDGWYIFKRIERSHNGTGGTFSHSYLAQKGQETAFVKAFDFSSAFAPEVDTVQILGRLTASFEHERDVLEHCRGRRLSHVAIAIGYGQISVPGMSLMEGRVHYLLFEKAKGDVRCQMDEADSYDSVWCVRTLRQVCLGLWQVHRELIAHQDVKPSNILCYEKSKIRLADFGRSSRRGHTIWHDDHQIAGDQSYAPPELLYGYLDNDFVRRRIGTDVYMLGNLVAFLFTGVNLTERLMAKLDPQHHHKNWDADYETALPYLQEAFGRVLQEITIDIDDQLHSRILPLVVQLGNPSLLKRGYPRLIGKRNQFSLEPYVSRLANMAKEVEVLARAEKLIK